MTSDQAFSSQPMSGLTRVDPRGRTILGINPVYVPLVATVLVLVLMYTAGIVAYHDRNFGSFYNFMSLFGGSAFLGIAAIGATFVILTGGIDLSVGAVVACTTILIASLVEEHGMSPYSAWAVGLCFGAALGCAMGCLIHFFDLPPFLVTLAGLFFARALGFVFEDQSIGLEHAFYREHIYALSINVSIPGWGRAPLELATMVLLLSYVLAVLLAHLTRFGRDVYAIGGDEASARLMGVPVGRTKILVYTLAGFCSALAGIVATFYQGSGNPASFVGLELDAIAAVVIGGTLLSGGVGFVAGTLMGVLILGLIQAIINFQGTLSSWWTRIVVGALVLGFILLQNLFSRLRGS